MPRALGRESKQSQTQQYQNQDQRNTQVDDNCCRIRLASLAIEFRAAALAFNVSEHPRSKKASPERPANFHSMGLLAIGTRSVFSELGVDRAINLKNSGRGRIGRLVRVVVF